MDEDPGIVDLLDAPEDLGDGLMSRFSGRIERRVRILNRGFPFGSNRDSL